MTCPRCRHSCIFIGSCFPTVWKNHRRCVHCGHEFKGDGIYRRYWTRRGTETQLEPRNTAPWKDFR